VFDTTIRDRFDAIAPHIVPGTAVLDLGCVDARPARRSGHTSAHAPDLLFRRLVEVNPDAVGVDHDAEGVAALQSAGYHAVCANVQTLDLGWQFDTIVAGELIEHLDNPGLFLTAVRRHLKPGGKLILTTPNPFYALQAWHIWRRGRAPRGPGAAVGLSAPTPPPPRPRAGRAGHRGRRGGPRCNEGHVVWFDPVTLTRLLRRCGFEPVEGYWIQPQRRWLKAWKRLFRRYFSHSFLIVATV
jgi:SAM-dependent methyltransferase